MPKILLFQVLFFLVVGCGRSGGDVDVTDADYKYTDMGSSIDNAHPAKPYTLTGDCWSIGQSPFLDIEGLEVDGVCWYNGERFSCHDRNYIYTHTNLSGWTTAEIYGNNLVVATVKENLHDSSLVVPNRCTGWLRCRADGSIYGFVEKRWISKGCPRTVHTNHPGCQDDGACWDDVDLHFATSNWP